MTALICIARIAGAFLLLALLPGLSGAATVRCLTPEGRIVYQDVTCPPGSRVTVIDDTPNKGFRFAQEREIRRLNRAAAEAVVAETAAAEARPPPRRAARKQARPTYNAAERRFITAGTSVAEVRRKIGPPDHIVRPSSGTERRSGRDTRQRWVYLPADDDLQTTMTLTVHRGRVLHVERKVTR